MKKYYSYIAQSDYSCQTLPKIRLTESELICSTTAGTFHCLKDAANCHCRRISRLKQKHRCVKNSKVTKALSTSSHVWFCSQPPSKDCSKFITSTALRPTIDQAATVWNWAEVNAGQNLKFTCINLFAKQVIMHKTTCPSRQNHYRFSEQWFNSIENWSTAWSLCWFVSFMRGIY